MDPVRGGHLVGRVAVGAGRGAGGRTDRRRQHLPAVPLRDHAAHPHQHRHVQRLDHRLLDQQLRGHLAVHPWRARREHRDADHAGLPLRVPGVRLRPSLRRGGDLVRLRVHRQLCVLLPRGGQAPMNAHTSHPRLRRAGLYALIVVILAMVIVPFGWMVLSSFKTPAEIRGLTDSWLPEGLYLGNYQGLQDTSFVTYFVNSIVIAVGTTALSIIIAVLAGYGLARFNFVGNRMLLIAIVTMQMFPAVLLAVPLYKMLSAAQLLDTRGGL